MMLHLRQLHICTFSHSWSEPDFQWATSYNSTQPWCDRSSNVHAQFGILAWICAETCCLRHLLEHYQQWLSNVTVHFWHRHTGGQKRSVVWKTFQETCSSEWFSVTLSTSRL